MSEPDAEMFCGPLSAPIVKSSGRTKATAILKKDGKSANVRCLFGGENPWPSRFSKSRHLGSVTTGRCRRHRDFLEGRLGPVYESATIRTKSRHRAAVFPGRRGPIERETSRSLISCLLWFWSEYRLSWLLSPFPGSAWERHARLEQARPQTKHRKLRMPV